MLNCPLNELEEYATILHQEYKDKLVKFIK